MIVAGSGPPLVLIPGIQGRWQWMRPAVRALSKHFRVITFSLRGGGVNAKGFDGQLEQVDEAMDRAGVNRAVVCGVSYGGLIAVRYAATRPTRVAALVLVSTPGPHWQPDQRSLGYVRQPWRSVPAFVLGARSRLWHEVGGAHAGDRRWKALAGYLWEVACHPPSPAMMARRVQALESRDFAADAKAVKAPTLVLTGAPDLDLVVPVAGTLEYVKLIPGARAWTLEGTGHIGLVTKAEEFAKAIREFATSVS